jgi:hypothetical protein
MGSFAVTIGSRPVRMDTILMILDDRHEAEEIAVELRRHGRDVEVHDLSVDPTRRGRAYRDVTHTLV